MAELPPAIRARGRRNSIIPTSAAPAPATAQPTAAASRRSEAATPTRAERSARTRYRAKGRRIEISAVPHDVANKLDAMFAEQLQAGEAISDPEFMRDVLTEVVARREAELGPLDLAVVKPKPIGAPRRYS